jgi:DnaJ family protein B protein 4
VKCTLEEFFHGTHHHYRFTRHYLSGKKKNVILGVKIPAGSRPGTKMRYHGVGNERLDGTLEDVVIVLEQLPHQWFGRQKNDLILDVELPWTKTLDDEKKAELFVEGVDGERFEFVVDKSVTGSVVFPDAGMPIRQGGEIVGRGNLIVRCVDLLVYLHSRRVALNVIRYRWKITTPPVSKWNALKKAFYFDR